MSETSTARAPSGLPAWLLHHGCAGIAWVVLHPARIPSLLTPGLQGLPYRRVRLEHAGTRLAAWHIPREGSEAGLVLCHGHNDSRAQFSAMLRPLHDAGFHLLLFDFRSMGVSGGSHCTYGYREQGDVLAAVEWLRQEAGVRRVGLYGLSMGGASALLAAARDPGIEAVVTDCAFARLEEMVERRFLYLPHGLRAPVSQSVRYWAERWGGNRVEDVDPEAAVRGWRPRPLLVIQAGGDLLVPPEHGERLAAAGGEQASLWTVPGAWHVRSRQWAGREYPRRVAGFFQQHLLCVANPLTDVL